MVTVKAVVLAVDMVRSPLAAVYAAADVTLRRLETSDQKPASRYAEELRSGHAVLLNQAATLAVIIRTSTS
jgi:hypothetical protein